VGELRLPSLDGWQYVMTDLAAIVDAPRQRWSLGLGDPFQQGGRAAWVAPARRGAPTMAVWCCRRWCTRTRSCPSTRSRTWAGSTRSTCRTATREFDPDEYQDDYRIQVLDLIGRKAAGEEFELPAAQAAKPKLADMTSRTRLSRLSCALSVAS
jgi:hypothetical protein